MVVAIIVAIRMFTWVMPPAMMPGTPSLMRRLTSGVSFGRRRRKLHVGAPAGDHQEQELRDARRAHAPARA